MIGQFICTPCNLDCDTLTFTEAGNCPHCNMALIPMEVLINKDERKRIKENRNGFFRGKYYA